MSRLTIDRYHAAMGSAAEMVNREGNPLSQAKARFYATQRKLHFAPVVGHSRLYERLHELSFAPDAFERGFLTADGNGVFAYGEPPYNGIEQIRTAHPGTILFAGQPIADITGEFGAAQSFEIAFEHSFDEPMTIASRALSMKMAADGATVMDFSLRRNGSAERALSVAEFAYIGGFDQTSNVQAGFEHGIPVVGTMAHYWVQAFTGAGTPEKHFQQVAFEAWLDANPRGTVLLLDTINYELGIEHAIAAAKSSERRLKAFKGVRIDSGSLASLAINASIRLIQEDIPLDDFKIILTGDLNAEEITRIVNAYGNRKNTIPLVFGVGTKLIAEVERVAGVIFKLAEINSNPTFKGSNSFDKATLPGELQIIRGVNKDDNYVGDITCLDTPEDRGATLAALKELGAVKFYYLLQPFYTKSFGIDMIIPPVAQQREKIQREIKKFGFIMNYPVRISEGLEKLRHKLWEEFNA